MTQINEKKIKREIKKKEENEYKEFVKKIKERDNWTCQISGKSFKNHLAQALPVCHILSKENYPELKLNLNNVLCLSYYNHKNSPLSPHLDGFAFTHFFKNKFPDRYNFLIKFLEQKNAEKL